MYSFSKTTGLIIANLVFTYIMMMVTKFRMDIKYIHLSIIIGVLVYSLILSYFLSHKTEGFFFEVSPQRKACLQKQVSMSPDENCEGCCGKGTKGGIPSRYNMYGMLLGDPNDVTDDDWVRNDWFNSCK